MPGRIYLAIDLKSFYASVECVERGLDPLTCNLVVADAAARKDHLPGGIPRLEGLRHTRQAPAVSGGGAGEGHQRPAPGPGAGPAGWRGPAGTTGRYRRKGS